MISLAFTGIGGRSACNSKHVAIHPSYPVSRTVMGRAEPTSKNSAV